MVRIITVFILNNKGYLYNPLVSIKQLQELRRNQSILSNSLFLVLFIVPITLSETEEKINNPLPKRRENLLKNMVTHIITCIIINLSAA